MLATYFQSMNNTIIDKAIAMMRLSFEGAKIELISQDLERSEPNDDFPKGYLFVRVNIAGTETELAYQIAEDIVTNPYGSLIADEIVFSALKDLYIKWKEDHEPK